MNIHISARKVKLGIAAIVVAAGFGTAAATTLIGSSPAAPKTVNHSTAENPWPDATSSPQS